MGFTTLIGLFIGSVIYDGDMKEMKKALITLGSYCIMIMISNVTRVIPQIPVTTPNKLHQLFASVTTLAIVTVFYLFGMFLGVYITKKAHKEL
jgi:hypothetical protein